MSGEGKLYRSPLKKLAAFFERSRDGWKRKCLAAKLRVKRLQTKVAELEASRQRWREEALRLRGEAAEREAGEQKSASAA